MKNRTHPKYIYLLGYLLTLALAVLTLRAGNFRNSFIVILISSALFIPLFFYLKDKILSNKCIIAVVVSIIFLRIAVMGTSPELFSKDVYRYLWDGLLCANEINPYSYAPDDRALLAHQLSPLYEKVDHKTCKTIYPPASQFLFWISAKLAPQSTLPLRIIFLLFELGSAYLLFRFTKSRVLPLLFLLSPLLFLEVGVGLHLDIVALFFVFAATFSLDRKKIFLSVTMLTIAVLIKIFPIVLAPLFFYKILKTHGKKVLFFSSLIAILLVVLSYLPFLSAKEKLFEQLFFYGKYWSFNGFFYNLFSLGGGQIGQIVRGAILLFAIYYAIFKESDLMKSIAICLLTFFLTSKVIYPWYFLSVLPFILIRPRLAELYLCSALFLSYVILFRFHREGVWEEPPYVSAVIFLPYVGLIVYDFFKRKSSLESLPLS